MWVFSDFGLLMPALIPANHVNDPKVLAWTNNGEYELQVRARLAEHLEYFMEHYMEEGTYNPTIQATPDKDYNYRFYTTREAYGEGIKQIALNMDYEKFKDSSERYSWNKKYHSLLTSIWGTLCSLNTPGGIWGPKSDDNPSGYSNARGWKSSYWYAEAHDDLYEGRRIGDSFRDLLFEEGKNYTTEELDAMGEGGVGSDMDYTPSWLTRTDDLIGELDSAGIPFTEWVDYVTDEEWELLMTEVEKRLREAQKEHRRSKKNRRKGRKAYSNH